VYSAWAAAAVFAWNLCADGIYGGDPDPVRRCDGQVDSAVCDWGVSCVHAVAGRDGGALAEDGEASGTAVARVCERLWRGGAGEHLGHCADCEVQGWSVGDGAADTYADRNHDGGEAALFAGEAGDGGQDAVEP